MGDSGASEDFLDSYTFSAFVEAETSTDLGALPDILISGERALASYVAISSWLTSPT